MDYTTPGIKGKKVLFLFVLIFVLALLLGGFFWWRGEERDKNLLKFEPLKNYNVRSTPRGNFVENKKIGLSFIVPKDWEIEKTDTIRWTAGIKEYGISLFSSDFELNNGSPWMLVPMKGCLIKVYTIYYDRYNDGMVEFINAEIDSLKAEKQGTQEIIKINGRPSLKETYGETEDLGDNPSSFFMVSVQTPVEDKICYLETYIPTESKDRCLKDFDEFLGNYTIK